MRVKIIGCFFAFFEAMMLGAQITTLISTYWTSWDLRFSWTQSRDYTRRPSTDGQLISEGHAGLWSRCVRVYDTGQEPSLPPNFNCLYNYDTSNGSLRFTFGKACKTATAALCLGDALLIAIILGLAIVSTFKHRKSRLITRILLPLLLLQGLICFAIPLTYLSGNMAELIDQLSKAYGLLMVVHMSPWYTHDWAFWAQIGLIGIWAISMSFFVLFYNYKHQQMSRHSKSLNGKTECGDGTELEALKGS